MAFAISRVIYTLNFVIHSFSLNLGSLSGRQRHKKDERENVRTGATPKSASARTRQTKSVLVPANFQLSTAAKSSEIQPRNSESTNSFAKIIII